MTASERERYSRQIAIEGFGEAAQGRLMRSGVFVAGAGGLGCAVSLYLAAAGLGRICIADHGDVEPSNLNRQVLYADADVGRRKVEAIAERLREANPAAEIVPVHATLEADTLPPLLEGCDLAIDALDNLPTRLALNQAAVRRGMPLIHGAVRGFSGQLMTVLPGESACLLCLYGNREGAGPAPVIGVAPGVIGLLEATEAIVRLAGLGGRPAGRLLLFDGLQMSFSELAIQRDPACPHCGQDR